MTRPRIVCLVPVRDEAVNLPGFLESAAACCDAVVALDDASSDGSAEILRASPVVAEVISKPREGGYEQWDDAANRNALLRAADALEPSWIVSLDADERLDAEDAAALREFLETDALAGCAYGLQHYRMWGDDLYVPEVMWIHRVFAWRPGLVFPERRLHFNPVPISVPRQAWLRTTIRIKHYGAIGEREIARRVAKYRAADPEGRYSGDFSGLSARPAPPQLQRWPPRQPGTPVLWAPPPARARMQTAAPDELDLAGPVASVVVLPQDPAGLARAARSVVEQRCSVAFEAIAVLAGAPVAAEPAAELARLRLVEVAADASAGTARNAGLRAARGDYVFFLEPGVELAPGALEACVAAHDAGHELVAASVVARGTGALAQASHLLCNHRALTGQATGRVAGPPRGCSYHREHLISLGGFPGDMPVGEDDAVNRALWQRGYSIFRPAAFVTIGGRAPRTPLGLLATEFRRGRAWRESPSRSSAPWRGRGAGRAGRTARSWLTDGSDRRCCGSMFCVRVPRRARPTGAREG